MSTQIESFPGCLRIIGDMTVYAAGQIKQPLLDALAEAPAGLQLDLSRVSEFDTAGLQLLLLARREALAKRRNLYLPAISSSVREALALCGALGLLVDAPESGSCP